MQMKVLLLETEILTIKTILSTNLKIRQRPFLIEINQY